MSVEYSVVDAAAIDQNTGQATGAGFVDAAFPLAQAGIANQDLRGVAIGDIASVLSSTLKERGRESRFEKKRPSQT